MTFLSRAAVGRLRFTAAAALLIAASTGGAAAVGTVAPAGAGGCPDLTGLDDALVRGEVFVSLTEYPGSNAKQGCVVGYIPAAPAAVMAIVRDADAYDEYMPRVERSEVTKDADGTVLNQQELNLPFPIGDRHFTVRLVEDRADNGDYRLGFSYVAGSGNINDTYGHWLVEAYAGGSRVTYVLWSDPGGAIPKWAVNRASRRTLPQVLVALRDRVRDLTPSHQAAGQDGPSS